MQVYNSTRFHTDSTRWVPVAAIIAVNAFQTIGFVSVVQLLLAESFPTEIRSDLIKLNQLSFWM